MNTHDIEQQRADFEAWLLTLGLHLGNHERQLMLHAYQAGRATLQSQEPKDSFCVWHNDPETDNSWDTSCRQLFEIYDGTPAENRMSFCCYCGKPIQEAIDHATGSQS